MLNGKMIASGLLLAGLSVPCLSDVIKPAYLSEPVPSGYTTPIPENIMTPDEVKTRIGNLEFHDGRPTPDTTALLYEHLDFIRGTQVFLDFIPMASLQALYEGHLSIGIDEPHKIAVFTKLMNATPLFLTGNTDSVYAMSFFDLSKTGPLVIEVPPGMGPSTVNDAFFRFVVDMGVPGPDKGKGGKYLILPPDYEGDLTPSVDGSVTGVDGEEYFISQSTSYVNWFVARGFLVDGKTDAAIESYRAGLRVYPLSQHNNPPDIEIISTSGLAYNTIHANDYTFFKEIDLVIQREPVSMLDPELRGLASAIGIEKGKAFEPDDTRKASLTDAVAVGNGIARSLVFDSRNDVSKIYPDRAWHTAFVGGDYQWLGGEDGSAGRLIDARTLFFYMATVNTPAMVLKIPGKGSQYALAYKDSGGKFLEGDKHYRLTIPANVPANDFWSVVVYDPQTRSELQTGQAFPSKNNKRDKLMENEDGSVDLYFGPTAPEGKESNWIETVPVKGWFGVLRLYGPTENWFNESWKPGDIEPSE